METRYVEFTRKSGDRVPGPARLFAPSHMVYLTESMQGIEVNVRGDPGSSVVIGLTWEEAKKVLKHGNHR